MTIDIVTSLRGRLITVPKPGTDPFVPPQPFWITVDTAQDHKPGDDAGLQYLPSIFTGCAASAPPPMRVQEHIYVVDPLCEEAAREIERLRTMLGPR